MNRLLVAGDVITDIVVRPAGSLVPGTDTAATITRCPGGSGANAATWAAHNGADTVLVGRIGADSGAWHDESLRASGVTPSLAVDDELPTGTVIAILDADGERTMITDRGAAARFGPADVDDSVWDGTSWVHLSGYLLFADAGRELARSLSAEAARRGVPVSVDPSSTGFLAAYGVERFLSDVDAAALLLPNEDEALMLAGVDDAVLAAEILSADGRTVVMTRGAAGCVAATNGSTVAVVSAPAVTVVDAVGAGDAFTGGFLAAALGRRAGAARPPTPGDLDACCRAGVASAAEAVATTGGRPSHGGRRGTATE